MKRDTILTVILFLVAILFFTAAIVFATHAHADSKWPRWSQEDTLNFGQCLRAEADMHMEDWPGIGHILIKRWRIQTRKEPRTIGQTVRDYCALFDKRSSRYYSQRSSRIRESTWENPLHGKLSEWHKIEVFVRKFVTGHIPDPCPEAEYFGGDIDIPPPNWVIVECGDTRNKFYKVPR